MRLTNHFTLDELTHSNTADEEGIDNSLCPINDHHKIANLQHLCDHILEPVRVHYAVPITPSSGYRCPQLNTMLGGSPKSQHMQGEAVDFTVPGVELLELARWMAMSLVFDQLILEPRWVHVSILRVGTNRNEVLTKTPKLYAQGLPTLV